MISAWDRLPRPAAAAAVLLITLLTFYFPGHTYLQSDTQIYVPMLEHIEDTQVMAPDLSATKPHLRFTLYDEAALGLRHLTHARWESILIGEQFLFRAAGVLGLYLLALALGVPGIRAMALAGWASLGAVIVGPAVLSIEYEPVPRGFAVGCVLLALGFMANERSLAAGAAAGVAILFHAPTALPFVAVLAGWALLRRDARPAVPVLAAFALLLFAAWLQPGQSAEQAFWGVIDPDLERLQRMRASYDWVSLWPWPALCQYPLLWGLTVAANFRLRSRGPSAWSLVILSTIGLLSIPVSYVLLDITRWTLMPQLQPARAALFTVLSAVVMAGAASISAGRQKRFIEAAAWMWIVLFIPLQSPLINFAGAPGADPALWIRRAAIALGAGLAAAWVLSRAPVRIASTALASLTIACFLLFPILGRVVNYPRLWTPELVSLSGFARRQTPVSSVFAFPDAGHGLEPGIFRAEAARAVYVDWKSGGQVNYYRDLAIEWWRRWQAVMTHSFTAADAPRFRAMGIDYVVVQNRRLPQAWKPAFSNSVYAVYALSGPLGPPQ